jgi:DNA-binding transcriptional regulator YhcF (GntR family)
MIRTTRFMVEIVTEDKIVSDDEKNEMAQNIANAIVNEAKTSGIVPEDSETFTNIVYVKEWYSDKQVIEHTFK